MQVPALSHIIGAAQLVVSARRWAPKQTSAMQNALASYRRLKPPFRLLFPAQSSTFVYFQTRPPR